MLLSKTFSVVLGAAVAVVARSDNQRSESKHVPDRCLQTADDNPLCFNTCAGVNQTVYDAAIQSFCTANANAKLSQYNNPGYYLSIGAPVTYQPDPNSGEQGVIWMEAAAIRNYTCPNEMVLDKDTCVYNFYVAVQKCNVSKEGKQGGIWTDPCLAFRFQPNPEGC